MTPVIVLTTVDAAFDVRPLALHLIEKRLAACVNVIDGVRSFYRWKEAIEEGGEKLLIIKTTDDRLGALEEQLFARHPYEVPEFVVLPVSGLSEAYRGWLLGAVERV
jgi:periplasmic divalent cation tolerance protein